MGRYDEFISMDGKAKLGIVANPELWSEDMKQYAPEVRKVTSKYARQSVQDFARILKYKDAGIPPEQIKFLMTEVESGNKSGVKVKAWELLKKGRPDPRANDRDKRAWSNLYKVAPKGTNLTDLKESSSVAHETYDIHAIDVGIEKKPRKGFIEDLAGNLWDVAKFAAPFVAVGVGMQFLAASAITGAAAAPTAAAAETAIATGGAGATAGTAAGTGLLSSGTFGVSASPEIMAMGGAGAGTAGTAAGVGATAAATPFLQTTAGQLLTTGGLALAEGFFSKPAEVPEMSPEEKEMNKAMLDDVRKASAEDKAITPLILQQMGIVENPDGTYRQMTEEENVAGMGKLQREQYDITGLELQRQKTALEGKLPLTEGTKQRYENERKEFEANMAQKLGPGWQTSTPGIQSEQAFESKWGLLKDEERYQQLQRGTGAIQAQYGLKEGIPAAKAGQFAAFPQRRTGLLNQYGKAAAPFKEQRGVESAYDVRAEERRTGLLKDIGRGIGRAVYPRTAGPVAGRY